MHELFVLALSLVWFAGATPSSWRGDFHFPGFLLESNEKKRHGLFWSSGQEGCAILVKLACLAALLATAVNSKLGKGRSLAALMTWHRSPGPRIQATLRIIWGCGPARNRKKIGKILVLASPRKQEKISRKIGKQAENCPKIAFSAHFPIFRLIFSCFLGEANTNIFPIFFLFRAGGPKTPF